MHCNFKNIIEYIKMYCDQYLFRIKINGAEDDFAIESVKHLIKKSKKLEEIYNEFNKIEVKKDGKRKNR